MDSIQATEVLVQFLIQDAEDAGNTYCILGNCSALGVWTRGQRNKMVVKGNQAVLITWLPPEMQLEFKIAEYNSDFQIIRCEEDDKKRSLHLPAVSQDQCLKISTAWNAPCDLTHVPMDELLADNEDILESMDFPSDPHDFEDHPHLHEDADELFKEETLSDSDPCVTKIEKRDSSGDDSQHKSASSDSVCGSSSEIVAILAGRERLASEQDVEDDMDEMPESWPQTQDSGSMQNSLHEELMIANESVDHSDSDSDESPPNSPPTGQLSTAEVSTNVKRPTSLKACPQDRPPDSCESDVDDLHTPLDLNEPSTDIESPTSFDGRPLQHIPIIHDDEMFDDNAQTPTDPSGGPKFDPVFSEEADVQTPCNTESEDQITSDNLLHVPEILEKEENLLDVLAETENATSEEVGSIVMETTPLIDGDKIDLTGEEGAKHGGDFSVTSELSVFVSQESERCAPDSSALEKAKEFTDDKSLEPSSQDLIAQTLSTANENDPLVSREVCTTVATDESEMETNRMNGLEISQIPEANEQQRDLASPVFAEEVNRSVNIQCVSLASSENNNTSQTNAANVEGAEQQGGTIDCSALTVGDDSGNQTTDAAGENEEEGNPPTELFAIKTSIVKSLQDSMEVTPEESRTDRPLSAEMSKMSEEEAYGSMDEPSDPSGDTMTSSGVWSSMMSTSGAAISTSHTGDSIAPTGFTSGEETPIGEHDDKLQVFTEHLSTKPELISEMEPVGEEDNILTGNSVKESPIPAESPATPTSLVNGGPTEASHHSTPSKGSDEVNGEGTPVAKTKQPKKLSKKEKDKALLRKQRSSESPPVDQVTLREFDDACKRLSGCSFGSSVGQRQSGDVKVTFKQISNEEDDKLKRSPALVGVSELVSKTDEELNSLMSKNKVIVNDDYKYPDSVTPTKVEHFVTESDYDVPYIDDEAFYCEDWYVNEDLRWSLLGRAHVADIDECTVTTVAQVNVCVIQEPAESPDGVKSLEGQVNTPMDDKRGIPRRKGILDLCGCVGRQSR